MEEWDIILLPGGTERAIMATIERWKAAQDTGNHDLMMLPDKYMNREKGDGLMFTICTGSLFLGALGCLQGSTAIESLGFAHDFGGAVCRRFCW